MTTARSSRSSFGSFPSHWLRARTATKYRLYYGAAGINRVRYDNERGKGDHRHLGDREEDYVFTTVEQLLADFESDVNEWS